MVQLGEVVQIDRTSIQPDQIADGQAYLGLEHIESGGRILRTGSVVAGELQSSKFAFDKRHVLFGKLRPNLAKIARPDFSGICSTDIVPLLPSNAIDRDYLAQFLLAPSTIAWAASRTAGVNLPRLSPSVLQSLDVPLPPLPEQRRIAEILDRADELRAKRRRTLALLDELSRSLFSTNFGSDHYGDATHERFENVIAEMQNGFYMPSSEYGSGTPILRIVDFAGGARLSLSNLSRVRAAIGDVERFVLAKGDLVVNRVNAMSHVGKSALVVQTPEKTIFESNMMRIRLDRRRIYPEYALAWLNTDGARAQIKSAAKQAINQASVNQQDIAALRLPIPSMEAQRAYLSLNSVIGSLLEQEASHLAKLDELFASLQQRAFSGQL